MPLSWRAMLSSAASESPCLGLAVRRGKRIRDALYALRRLELSCGDGERGGCQRATRGEKRVGTNEKVTARGRKKATNGAER